MPSAEYIWWTQPTGADGHCQQDPCCIICGNGDPTPESGHGAIPIDPDENGQVPGYTGELLTDLPTCGYGPR